MVAVFNEALYGMDQRSLNVLVYDPEDQVVLAEDFFGE